MNPVLDPVILMIIIIVTMIIFMMTMSMVQANRKRDRRLKMDLYEMEHRSKYDAHKLEKSMQELRAVGVRDGKYRRFTRGNRIYMPFKKGSRKEMIQRIRDKKILDITTDESQHVTKICPDCGVSCMNKDLICFHCGYEW